MKKGLIIAAGLGLALVFIVLPVLLGFALERAYPPLIERLQNEAPGLDLVEGHFDRGLFSSTAVARFRLPGAAGAPLALEVDQNWVHGPFALSEWFSGFVPIPPVLARVRGQIRPVEAGLGVDWVLRVNLDGTLDLEASSPAFASTDGSLSGEAIQAELSIQGGIRGGRGQIQSGELRLISPGLEARLEPSTLDFRGALSEAGSRVEGTFELGPGSIQTAAGARVGWAPSFGTFDASRAPNERDSSAIDIDLGDLEISSTGSSEPVAMARGARLQIDLKSEDRRLERLQLVMSLDSLEVGANRLGPGLVRVAAKGVDLGALVNFREALGALAVAEEDPVALAELEANLLREWIPALVASSPELRVEAFEIDGPDGRLEATGLLSIDGSEPEAFAEELSAMEAVGALAEFAIPTAILHNGLDLFLAQSVAAEAPELPDEEILAMAQFMREMALGQLLGTGMLKPQGGRYRIEFRFEQGVPVVNGKLLGPGGLAELLSGG
ncbi:MAG: DUF945 family protein [Myxococcota bacterium]|nr:DUF945 family protein [Myxococcota bacterium]